MSTSVDLSDGRIVVEDSGTFPTVTYLMVGSQNGQSVLLVSEGSADLLALADALVKRAAQVVIEERATLETREFLARQ